MVDFGGLIDSVASLQDSFKESFEILKRFLLNVELSAYSITFVLLFLLFMAFVFLLLSSPALLYNLYINQLEAIKKFIKKNKNPRDWIGKS